MLDVMIWILNEQLIRDLLWVVDLLQMVVYGWADSFDVEELARNK